MANQTQKRSDNDEEVINTADKLEHFHELIKDIEIAMLTSVTPEGALVSRPMATQRVSSDGSLWFMTNIETHKVGELAADSRVNLAYYKDRTREFVSVSGVAQVNTNRAKIHELYAADWKAWLGVESDTRDGGPDDPRIALIEVVPHSVSYLKLDRPAALVMLSVLKGVVTGDPPKVGEVGKLTQSELTPASSLHR